MFTYQAEQPIILSTQRDPSLIHASAKFFHEAGMKPKGKCVRISTITVIKCFRRLLAVCMTHLSRCCYPPFPTRDVHVEHVYIKRRQIKKDGGSNFDSANIRSFLIHTEDLTQKGLLTFKQVPFRAPTEQKGTHVSIVTSYIPFTCDIKLSTTYLQIANTHSQNSIQSPQLSTIHSEGS